MSQAPVILASTSPYRRAQLQRLHLAFEMQAPACDETPEPGERAPVLVERLARAKARSVAATRSAGLVIGSDQVAACGDRILTKPGHHEPAREQLQAVSGRTVTFCTGLCLIDAASDREQGEYVDFAVDFRVLSDAEIERYLAAEQPYDCAGSIRSEGYAVVLFERMRGDDPSALIGLPLIRLRALLADFGLALP